MPKVTFLPAEVSVDVPPGTTVFSAAAQAEVAIPSQCGGKCACALCRVQLVSGESVVDPMGWEEEGHLGNTFWLTRERLSCQLRVFGDVVVQVAPVEVRDKPRGRYIPRSLVAKREKMERDEELRRARAGARRPSSPPVTRESKAAKSGESSESVDRTESTRTSDSGDGARPGEPRRGKERSGTHRKGGRRRRGNPGAPRSGDSRPPPGARKKDN